MFLFQNRPVLEGEGGGGGGGDPFAGIKFPEKFLKDGKPDLTTFVNSYGELETKFNTKTDELKTQLKTELETERNSKRPKEPTAYEIPKIENVDQAELAAHPMVAWWRQEAYDAGIPQERFAKGIEEYIKALAPKEIGEDVLKQDLGDNFKQRIAAVDAWAQKTGKDEAERAALAQVATSTAGVKLLERLAGLSGTGDAGGGGGGGGESLTLEQLRAMQKDPKYWDAKNRDPAFVKKVEEGYEKLYPSKK